MRSGKNIAHKFLEKPAMYKKLPDLKDKSILCIGCGTGEECEHLKSLGAKRVVGIDISKGLIDFAKKVILIWNFKLWIWKNWILPTTLLILCIQV